MSVVFDKLSFVKRLEGAGSFTRLQAEALSEAFHGAVVETITTKSDLDASKAELKSELSAFRSEVKADTAALRSEVTTDFATLRSEVEAGSANLRLEVKAEISTLWLEVKADSAQRRVAIAESKVWTVSVGATIVAGLAARTYFG
jgi:hypothetical protein